MSSGHDEHVPGINEPREISNPVLWTVGLLGAVAGLAFVFFHFKQVGREEAKGEPVWTLPVKAAGPDHAALIADKSQAVIDRGEVLYSKNCASCHGAAGDTNPSNVNPKPRNFHAEPLKGKWGSGPYGFYMTLTDGYGGAMPAFRNLPAEDRYAVGHFIRETWMKPNAQATGYTEKDADAIVKQIPAAGAAGAAGGEEIDPTTVQPPKTTYPLLAAVAQAEQQDRANLVRWLSDAATDCGPELTPSFRHLRAQWPTQNGRLARLYTATRQQDKADFAAVLVGEDGSGSADPFFSLQSEDTLRKLFARLAETATRTNP
jgi:mono/diheme cytochrome c family protein